MKNLIETNSLPNIPGEKEILLIVLIQKQILVFQFGLKLSWQGCNVFSFLACKGIQFEVVIRCVSFRKFCTNHSIRLEVCLMFLVEKN